MYDANDPRSALNKATATAPPASAGGDAEYARFYAEPPQDEGPEGRTWYHRGQNFITSVTLPTKGGVLTRENQIDEYAILLPDRGSRIEVSTAAETKTVEGNSLVFVPPGFSKITVIEPGQTVRLFTTKSPDLVARCSNRAAYAQPKPNVALAEPWPDPVGGFKIRVYDLDPPPEKGRFGRIWRCTTLMINVLPSLLRRKSPRTKSLVTIHDFRVMRWRWRARTAPMLFGVDGLIHVDPQD